MLRIRAESEKRASEETEMKSDMHRQALVERARQCEQHTQEVSDDTEGWCHVCVCMSEYVCVRVCVCAAQA